MPTGPGGAALSFARGFALFALLAPACGHAAGVSPYLPLQLNPAMERDIAHVMILADEPVLRRPIAASAVLAALPKACHRDPVLCRRVGAYLSAYTRKWSLTQGSATLSASTGAKTSVPNGHGTSSDDHLVASGSALWQPSAWFALSLGAVADEHHATPTGSMLSVGTSHLQLDAGYADHWFSPFTDSSMLISTEAQTIPSLTLHDHAPMTRFGFEYELFIGQMSASNQIEVDGVRKRGYPKLLGFHVGSRPVPGWSVGLNRLMQFGGAGRAEGISDVFQGFINPHNADNNGGGVRSELGNQQSSFVASFIYPGATPFAAYVEYAGEDTSDSKNYLLGNSSLSLGIHVPALLRRFDVTYEISEWQNEWWIHHLYGDGVTNDGFVLGHWGGDWRNPGDGVGARSQMLQVVYDGRTGRQYSLRLRTLQNQDYSPQPYQSANEATLGIEQPMRGWSMGTTLTFGRDVYGDHFGRAGVNVHLDPHGESLQDFDTAVDEDPDDANSQRFVTLGLGSMQIRYRHDTQADWVTLPDGNGVHFGIGARRAVGSRSDLGVRLDYDRLGARSLIAARALDYRYRFMGPLSISAFAGAARYAAPTPALGWYLGAGVQWRNILPRTDLELEYRAVVGLQRDRLLSGESGGSSPDEFYSMSGPLAALAYRF